MAAASMQVRTLGYARFDSPLASFVAGRVTNEHYVAEDDRVVLHDTVSGMVELGPSDDVPSFEAGGPRGRLFFEPGRTRVGIVTCGGLCPGLNDVIRGLVIELASHYAVTEILGFRHGFAGLVQGAEPPMELTPTSVADIHHQGGTVLGTSRGAQDPDAVVDTLLAQGIDILFVIGGDGSMRGAGTIAAALARREEPIAVIGIPKTIDNDIPFIGQSFGFVTAFSAAARAITTGEVEAKAAVNGVGLVRVMGRHAGFIACYAALANQVADAVLIPEVPFTVENVVRLVRRRVAQRGHAVVVLAEGAGQDLQGSDGATDASGNARLSDVGSLLRGAIGEAFAAEGAELNLKFVDPGYAIRSVPADPQDAVYCVRLAQTAVHAGMAGRTDMVVGRRHNRFIHVPIPMVVSDRNQVAPDGDLWLSVLEATSQPADLA